MVLSRPLAAPSEPLLMTVLLLSMVTAAIGAAGVPAVPRLIEPVLLIVRSPVVAVSTGVVVEPLIVVGPGPAWATAAYRSGAIATATQRRFINELPSTTPARFRRRKWRLHVAPDALHPTGRMCP